MTDILASQVGYHQPAQFEHLEVRSIGVPPRHTDAIVLREGPSSSDSSMNFVSNPNNFAIVAATGILGNVILGNSAHSKEQTEMASGDNNSRDKNTTFFTTDPSLLNSPASITGSGSPEASLSKIGDGSLKRNTNPPELQRPLEKKKKDNPPNHATLSEQARNAGEALDPSLRNENQSVVPTSEVTTTKQSLPSGNSAAKSSHGRSSQSSRSRSAPTGEGISSDHVSESTPNGGSTGANNENPIDYSDMVDQSFAELIKLENIPNVPPLSPLNPREIAELESALQIGDKYNHGPDGSWKNDWSGNLQLYDKEVIVNRGHLANHSAAKPIKIPFCDCVAKNSHDGSGLRGIKLLFSYVYHMKSTPAMAKKIMAYSLARPASTAEQRLEFVLEAVRRISFDPVVLREDGWTTKKSDSPEGGLGGAFMIGRRVIWQRYEAVVIAFVRDDEFGALWKAVWLEDLDTFDLEAGELQDGLKKWDTKQAKLNKKNKPQATRSTSSIGSTRFASSANLSVDGIEHGIVLAAPSNKAGRGVLWPARVVHIAESNPTPLVTGSRRSSTKSVIQVVFLAPFWNVLPPSATKMSDIKDPYSNGPLFEYDNIDVSESTIQKYPFESLLMSKLQASFRFIGLPKAVFSRYLDSHRLALALKIYARKRLSKNHSADESHAIASAALTESHTLSVRTPMFPQVVLDIPFDFVLSKLPHPSEHASASIGTDEDNVFEPVIDIDAIITSLSPPGCFGKRPPSGETSKRCSTPDYVPAPISIASPFPQQFKSSSRTQNSTAQNQKNDKAWSIENFASNFLVDLLSKSTTEGSIPSLLGNNLTALISRLRLLSDGFGAMEEAKCGKELKKFLCHCLTMKAHGEDSLECANIPAGMSGTTIVIEWRKACERVYKAAMKMLSSEGVGNGITTVLTDSRCNGHVTANGSYERPVRIPAAIKGAKMAGAGHKPNILLISEVEDCYLDLAVDKIIPKAHKVSYVRRMKTKIAALPADAKGVPLTDDSDGEGGEDTVGSRGSYTAAVVGVAAALKAVDMVVGGQCVNVFCATRPPGHHAGRELHPMKAISNGFCLLNPAACAAIFAATPQSQGGLGLRRVCVIDFDVHHGNGTQDILCSTHDPRFLYISLHAGGAHINGFDDEDSQEESFRRRLGGKSTDGIFPGRCGDSSPHDGVLNIPLGSTVSANAVGTALVSRVSPRVEKFSPDLIILSAGFDAHKNDPLGMGALSAEDFGSVTDVACQMAYKTCSGRILSVLEGGYGVPCCRPREDLFLPEDLRDYKLLELGDDLPDYMDDPVPFTLRQKLEKCHAEGFLDCVKEHVRSFARCNERV